MGTCRQQSLPHTGGRWRSQRNVSGPVSTALQLPEWMAWVPKTSQGRPGGARQCGGVPPPPELRTKAHTGARLPATRSRDEGAEIPGSLHPQGRLSPRKSECLLSAAVIRVGGGGGQHESVSPSRAGWGPKLLVAAGAGKQATGSPCPPTPTSQVGAVSTSGKIKRLWKLLSAKLPPPSEKVSVFEPASPKV